MSLIHFDLEFDASMKKAYTLSLLLPTLALPCDADLFPNGDFQDGNTSWVEVGVGGTFVFSYPPSGGSPNSATPDEGFGIIDHSSDNGGFGIWVGNDETPLLLADLNLEAGKTYNFSQDMKILSGSNLGGFKIDFTNGGAGAGTSGEKYPTVIGEGTTWETYTFEIPIPSGVDGFKVVPLWGPGSSIAFDNIGFDPTPVLPPVEPPVIEPSREPQLTEGTLVTWIPGDDGKFYQPQSSQDDTTWADLGPAFFGTDTTTILDPNSAPFYRVLEKKPAGEQALINGDFENADINAPNCPESWACLSTSGQFPTRIETDSFSGSASIRLAVQNDGGGAPKQAEIQQNLGAVGGFVTPGETYTFSFRAKQISSGVSYVQNYRLQWFDDGGAPINGADVGFNAFSGGEGSWAEISAANLVAPPQAASVFIQIFGATGAVAGDAAKGEVLIDNVSLSIGAATQPTALAATTGPGIGVTLLTKTGVTYKAQQSEDLETYEDLSGTFTGNGQVVGAGIPDGGPSHFFRILKVEEEAN